ncbi:hypothetical protein KBD59_01235 [Candidatus Gracilibacteria bacterium]|nr:hypothetical protein [Candidatus Gracilibacteria bacterium]
MARNLGFKEAAFVIGTSFLGGDVDVREPLPFVHPTSEIVHREKHGAPPAAESFSPNMDISPVPDDHFILNIADTTRSKIEPTIDYLAEKAAEIRDEAELLRAQARGEVIEIKIENGCVSAQGGGLGFSNCSSGANDSLSSGNSDAIWEWYKSQSSIHADHTTATKRKTPVFRGNWNHRGKLTVSQTVSQAVRAIRKNTPHLSYDHTLRTLSSLHLDTRFALLQHIILPFETQEDFERKIRLHGKPACEEKVDGINTLLSGVTFNPYLSEKLDTLGFEEYDIGPLGNGWMLDDELCDQSY